MYLKLSFLREQHGFWKGSFSFWDDFFPYIPRVTHIGYTRVDVLVQIKLNQGTILKQSQNLVAAVMHRKSKSESWRNVLVFGHFT